MAASDQCAATNTTRDLSPSNRMKAQSGECWGDSAPPSGKATPQVRVLAERHGGDVSFSFDSNGRSVWVMALFGKSAPPALRTVSDGEMPWTPLDDEQEEGKDEEGEN